MANVTRAKQTSQDHGMQKTHRIAMEDAVAFVDQMEGGILSIG